MLSLEILSWYSSSSVLIGKKNETIFLKIDRLADDNTIVSFQPVIIFSTQGKVVDITLLIVHLNDNPFTPRARFVVFAIVPDDAISSTPHHQEILNRGCHYHPYIPLSC